MGEGWREIQSGRMTKQRIRDNRQTKALFNENPTKQRFLRCMQGKLKPHLAPLFICICQKKETYKTLVLREQDGDAGVDFAHS